MPILTWPSKVLTDIEPADLILDSVFYPRGFGYPDAIPFERLLFSGTQTFQDRESLI
jgi:hypothetical protein